MWFSTFDYCLYTHRFFLYGRNDERINDTLYSGEGFFRYVYFLFGRSGFSCFPEDYNKMGSCVSY